MTAPHDTTPPPAAPTTSPMLPESEPAIELPIPSGEAQQTLSQALDALVRAVHVVEAIGMAACRALDATATKETTT
jgi:hypothetical protein